MSPGIVLLNIWSSDNINTLTKDLLVSFLLLGVAKVLIAQLWKMLIISTFKSWFNKIWDYMVMDKTSDQLSASENSLYQSYFMEKWFSF